MKKNFIAGNVILMFIILLAVISCNGEPEEEMLVYNSSSIIMGEYHKERIVVIVNRKEIENRQDCAERIVEKCRKNSFKNIRFSYDLSKPNELDITVCRNEKEADDGEWDFRFRYVQGEGEEKYNIIDHPERFRTEILHEK